jgi:hypothetical protein
VRPHSRIKWQRALGEGDSGKSTPAWRHPRAGAPGSVDFPRPVWRCNPERPRKRLGNGAALAPGTPAAMAALGRRLPTTGRRPAISESLHGRQPRPGAESRHSARTPRFRPGPPSGQGRGGASAVVLFPSFPGSPRAAGRTPQGQVGLPGSGVLAQAAPGTRCPAAPEPARAGGGGSSATVSKDAMAASRREPRERRAATTRGGGGGTRRRRPRAALCAPRGPRWRTGRGGGPGGLPAPSRSFSSAMLARPSPGRRRRGAHGRGGDPRGRPGWRGCGGGRRTVEWDCKAPLSPWVTDLVTVHAAPSPGRRGALGGGALAAAARTAWDAGGQRRREPGAKGAQTPQRAGCKLRANAAESRVQNARKRRREPAAVSDAK